MTVGQLQRNRTAEIAAITVFLIIFFLSGSIFMNDFWLYEHPSSLISNWLWVACPGWFITIPLAFFGGWIIGDKFSKRSDRIRQLIIGVIVGVIIALIYSGISYIIEGSPILAFLT